MTLRPLGDHANHSNGHSLSNGNGHDAQNILTNLRDAAAQYAGQTVDLFVSTRVDYYMAMGLPRREAVQAAYQERACRGIRNLARETMHPAKSVPANVNEAELRESSEFMRWFDACFIKPIRDKADWLLSRIVR